MEMDMMLRHLYMLSSKNGETVLIMKKKSFIATLIGITGFLFVGFVVMDIVRQKWDYESDNAAQMIVEGYYKEPIDSLDVLFLGASTIRNGMSPLEIYEQYGITGYSRATSVQIPLISYYLMMETLKTQNLKAVVIDASSLSSLTDNSEKMEGKYHEAIDYMPLSEYKMAIIEKITKGSTYTKWDFLLPLYRYHDRWQQLDEYDFSYRNVNSDYCYKGQYPILRVEKYSFPEDYMQEGKIQDDEFYIEGDAREYYELMIEECKKRNIEFIMVKTPVGSWDMAKHDMVQNFADVEDVDFIDFNMPDIREEIEFNSETDYCDNGRHPNISGAMKMSRYVGNYIQSHVNMQNREGAVLGDWNESVKKYDCLKEDQRVLRESNLIKFLKKIDKDRYTVVIAARNDTTKFFTDEIRKAFADLGLSVDMKGASNQNYVAVFKGKKVVYEKQDAADEVTFSGEVGGIYISALSKADKATGNTASIMIDGVEKSVQEYGFNILVYDNYVGQVIARRAFDTGRTGKLYTTKD